MSESYRVLTRKYRPRSFDDVVSQGHVISTLRNAIEQGRISHAYLFCGPRGVGKTTMARVVARMINGVGMDVDGEELGRTLDIIEIDAASNSGVDDVRQLRDGVRVPPQNGTYKVYIIDEVHMLSKAAFNALLKTLEEPPSYVKFIFATTEPHKVLPTVLSRCQRFDFRRIKVGEIVDRLRYICDQEGITIDDTSLHVIARKADGALRDALSIMDQAIAFCGQNITRQGLLEALNVVGSDRLYEMIECAAQRNTTRAMQIVDALLLEGHDIQEFLIALTEHIRNLYLARDAASAGLIEATEEELEQMRVAAKDFSEQDLLRMLHLVNEAQFKVREAQQPRIQLEITILRLVTMDRSESLNQLLSEIRDLKKKLHEPGLSPKNEDIAAPGEHGSAKTSDEANRSGAVRRSGSTNPPPDSALGSTAEAAKEPASAKISIAPKTESVHKPGSTDGAEEAGTTENIEPNGEPDSKIIPDNTDKSAAGNTNRKGALLDSFLGKAAIKKKRTITASEKASTASAVEISSASDSKPPDLPQVSRSDSKPHKSESLGVNSSGHARVADSDITKGSNLGTVSREDTQKQSETPSGTRADTSTVYTSNGVRDNESEFSDGIGYQQPSDVSDVDSVDFDGEDYTDSVPADSGRVITLEEMQATWPVWLEQVRKDCQQLVYFTLSKTRLSDIKDRTLVIECQDELVRQMIRQHEVSLTDSLRKILNVSMSLKTLVHYNSESLEEDNDPYAQFKKARAVDPKVDMIVNILGAELEY